MARKKEKRFLSYGEQSDYLNGKGVSCYGKEEMIMLRRLGYFNLVSGYKWPFVLGCDEDGSYFYLKGTSVEQMTRVKVFDDELRVLLLRYITKAEDEIRSIAAYKFDDVNFEVEGEVCNWNEPCAFAYGRSVKDVKKLIARMERELSFSRVSYLKEYRRKYDRVPTWLLFKFINFSTFVTAIDYAKVQVKDDICRLYGVEDRNKVLDRELLITSLHWIRMVRNVCAHNERVYDVSSPFRVVERYFELLPKEYSECKDFKRLIDLLVYLKYFLDTNDYAGLLGQFEAMVFRLEGEILPDAFKVILRDMGVFRVSDLDNLLREKKVADYLGL